MEKSRIKNDISRLKSSNHALKMKCNFDVGNCGMQQDLRLECTLVVMMHLTKKSHKILPRFKRFTTEGYALGGICGFQIEVGGYVCTAKICYSDLVINGYGSHQSGRVLNFSKVSTYVLLSIY